MSFNAFADCGRLTVRTLPILSPRLPTSAWVKVGVEKLDFHVLLLVLFSDRRT